MKPSLDRMWETFLHVDAPAKACAELAVKVLEILRGDVLPYVRELQRAAVIDWFSVLLHGPPTTEHAKGVYVHLRMHVSGDVSDLFKMIEGKALPGFPWIGPQKIEAPDCREIAGVSRSYLLGQDIERAWGIIGMQAEWILSVIEQYDGDISCIELQKEFAQYLHFFSNPLVFPDRVPLWLMRSRPSKWLFLWEALKGVFRRGQ